MWPTYASRLFPPQESKGTLPGLHIGPRRITVPVPDHDGHEIFETSHAIDIEGVLNNGKFFENRIRNVLILKKVEIQKQAILVIIQQALEVKYANT